MKAAFVLIVLSLALLGTSVTVPPFRLEADGSLPMLNVAEGDSEAYFSTWEQAVTAKFRLQDYGVTLLTFAVLLAVISRRSLKAPSSRLSFVILAALAPFLTVIGYAFDLMQAQTRWEFPPWGDSLGIPIMGVPVMFVAGLAWALSHFILLAGIPQRAGVCISFSAIRQGHRWLLAVSALTAILIAIAAAEGAYCYTIPGLVWLYFYAAIAAVRQVPE